MKKMSLFIMLATVGLLLAVRTPRKKHKLITCQQEKVDMQGQLDQANATILQKDQKIEAIKGENRELNQKALKSSSILACVDRQRKPCRMLEFMYLSE